MCTERGWSQQQIARMLEINRETVARYVRQLRAALVAKSLGNVPSEAISSPVHGVPFKSLELLD